MIRRKIILLWQPGWPLERKRLSELAAEACPWGQDEELVGRNEIKAQE